VAASSLLQAHRKGNLHLYVREIVAGLPRLEAIAGGQDEVYAVAAMPVHIRPSSNAARNVRTITIHL
jgi:hypothetical protein